MNVGAIIPDLLYHASLHSSVKHKSFFLSHEGVLSLPLLRVQRKPLRLPLSSNLPYENITGESTFDSSVYETTVRRDWVDMHSHVCFCVMRIFDWCCCSDLLCGSLNTWI